MAGTIPRPLSPTARKGQGSFRPGDCTREQVHRHAYLLMDECMQLFPATTASLDRSIEKKKGAQGGRGLAVNEGFVTCRRAKEIFCVPHPCLVTPMSSGAGHTRLGQPASIGSKCDDAVASDRICSRHVFGPSSPYRPALEPVHLSWRGRRPAFRQPQRPAAPEMFSLGFAWLIPPELLVEQHFSIFT